MPTENHTVTVDRSNSSSSYAELVEVVQCQIGDWSKFSKKLRDRKKNAPLRKAWGRNAFYWGLPSSDAIYCSTIARLVQLKASGKPGDFDFSAACDDWIALTTEEAISVPVALEGLAWASALPRLTQRLGEVRWKNLLATLLFVSQVNHDRKLGRVFIQLLLGAELNLVLTYVTSELAVCKKRASVGRQQFEHLMDAMLDGEGMPHSDHLDCIQLMLASCTRSLTIDGLLKKGRIDKSARLQFDWLCRQTLRLARPDGGAILSGHDDSPHFDELLSRSLEITGDESDLAAVKTLRGKRKSVEGEDLPAAAEHSDWSEVVTMRTNWTPNAARLAVVFAARQLRTEFAIGRQVVFCGKNNPKIKIDGRELALASDWEEVCWESDEDMDYIELDAKLDDGWRIQRQVLLARQDSFALISDALTGPVTAEISYQNGLPLCDGVTLDQTGENTESLLLGDKQLGRILPLSLSEWKTPGANSRLRDEPARLEISQRGRGLYAPLFIDFDARRRSKAITWRTLTVAEQLRALTPDVAVAYRVQIGKKHWVIYRSLAKPGNRTFLGLNLTSEFVVARFHTDGEIEPIVDVSV